MKRLFIDALYKSLFLLLSLALLWPLFLLVFPIPLAQVFFLYKYSKRKERKLYEGYLVLLFGILFFLIMIFFVLTTWIILHKGFLYTISQLNNGDTNFTPILYLSLYLFIFEFTVWSIFYYIKKRKSNLLSVGTVFY